LKQGISDLTKYSLANGIELLIRYIYRYTCVILGIIH
jgi:hypothetical protein